MDSRVVLWVAGWFYGSPGGSMGSWVVLWIAGWSYG